MTALRPAFARLFAASQYGFPFLPGPAPTPVARLRRLTGPARLPKRRKWLRGPAYIGMLCIWPFGALFMATRLEAPNPRAGRRRRIFGAWWLAMTRNVPPFEYQAYHLDVPSRRADLHEYLFWTDQPAIAELNRRRGAIMRDVQDKARFSEICSAHGLPCVPSLAVFRSGKQVAPELPFVPTDMEFWAKSLAGSGAQGAALWRREGEFYSNDTGMRLSAQALASYLSRTDSIVQPWLTNHPRLAEVTNGALASVRILTGIDAASRAAVVTAMIYLPSRDRTTSIASIACAIDLVSGTLTRAVDLQAGSIDIEHHPDTGERIVGRVLPFWSESLALAVRAHESAFARFAFLGWDLALTPNGPVLLEANAGWGALHLQMLNGPIGLTDFSRILADHV